jgi:hypothetical protein
MDTYSALLMTILLVLVILPFLNIFWIIRSFRQDLRRGFASLLFFLMGYLLYLLFRLIENELQLGVTERISDYLSYLEGRILITIFCLFIGGMVALIYCTQFIKIKESSQANFSYLLLFLSFTHSALLDSYLTLKGLKQLTFYRVLPSISFVVAFGLTFALRLFMISGSRHDTITESVLFAKDVDENPEETDTGNDDPGFSHEGKSDTDDEEDIPF